MRQTLSNIPQARLASEQFFTPPLDRDLFSGPETKQNNDWFAISVASVIYLVSED